MNREDVFYSNVENGGFVDATDWMPDDYKNQVRRIMGFQALAEIVGSMMFSEWIPKVPSLVRKMMYTAKSQDEMGHAHILIRACEDLELTREEIIEGYISGKNKLLNIFHYSFNDYEEMVAGMLLQNAGAIIQFQSLVQGSYLPYQRALRKIMKEEAFHYNLAINMIQQINKYGTNEQKIIMQKAFDIWFPRMLGYFGPPESKKNDALKWRIKVDSNETIRQRWINKIVPLVRSLGYTINDPLLKIDDQTKTWSYTMPDWNDIKNVIKGGGPRSDYWREKVQESYEDSRWIREFIQNRNIEFA